MAADLKVDYFEMSAKTGENVEELFEKVLDNLDNVKCHDYHSSLGEIKERKGEDSNATDNKFTNNGQEKLPESPKVQLTSKPEAPPTQQQRGKCC
jgi:hypothetical protein